MQRYSLKQFLIESDRPEETHTRRGSVDRLIGGMQRTKSLTESFEAPIVPQGTGWAHLTDPNRLRRQFIIEEVCSRRIFVNDVLNLADESMHHIEVHVLSDTISIDIYTEDLNDITEMDFEYAKDVDEMYVDAMFSCSNSNLGDTNELW